MAPGETDGDPQPAEPGQAPGAGGASLAGYELISKLGQGGMGVVYKARQRHLDRLVALKVLPRNLARNEEFTRRFLREARAAGKLSHPNIVAGIDAGFADGYYYFAMEYVEGRNLGDRLSADGPLPEREAAEIGRQIAEALAHAHGADLVHRDVKPENILLTDAGQAKLCDLGLARGGTEDLRLTQTGMAVGTPYYISPEQACGAEPDGRSDIYSLGSTLYHLVSGAAPFEGANSLAVMQKHITEEPPPLSQTRPEISRALEAVVGKMMAKAPEQRYQSAAEAAEDLRRVASGEVPRALGAALTGRGRRPRRPGTTVATAALRAVGAGAGAAEGAAGRRITSTTLLLKAVRSPKLRPVLLVAGGLLIAAAAFFLFWAVVRTPPATTRTPLAGQPGADPLKLLAERFQAAQTYETANPRSYAAIVSLYRGLVRDGAGTEFEARARQAIAALEQRQQADQSAERLEALGREFERLRGLEAAGPDNYAKLISAYEKFVGGAVGTGYEAKARAAAEAVRKRRLERAEEALAILRGRVEAASAAGDCAGALKDLEAFPPELAPEAEKALAGLRQGVLAAGRAHWQGLLAEGRKLAAAHKFDEAAAAVAKGKSLGLPELDAPVAAALGEVEAARAAFLAARAAESEQAYAEFAREFARRLAAGDCAGAAALDPGRRLLPEQAARARADLAFAAAAGDFLKRLRDELARRPPGSLSVRLPTGSGAFQAYSRGTDKLSVKSSVAGEDVHVEYELARLDRAELLRLARRCAGGRDDSPLPPRPAFEAACFLLAAGQAAGVAGLLEAARAGGVDVGDLPTRLAIIEKGAGEAEAERLLAEFDRLFKAANWAPAAAAGEKLLKDYAGTGAVAARAEELARLVDQARGAGAPQLQYTLTLRQGAAVPELKLDEYKGVSDTALAIKEGDGPEHGSGGAISLSVCFLKEAQECRSVIRFDLGAIPADARIQKAVLRLTCWGTPSLFNVNAYRVTSPWVASTRDFAWDEGASWTWASGAGKGRVPWKTPGGDFDASTDWGQGANGLLGKPLQYEAGKVWDLDVTPLAQTWVSGKLPNHGILLRPEAVAGAPKEAWAGFMSSEYDRDAAKRPALLLTLTARRLGGGGAAPPPSGCSVEWTEVSPKLLNADGKARAAGPPYREGVPGAAYDPARGLCLLAGGGCDDLWAYDAAANSWTCLEEYVEKHPADGVTRPLRAYAGALTPLVCPPAGDRYWLACGEKGELWAFDPQALKWQKKLEIGRPARALGWLAPDSLLALLRGIHDGFSDMCLVDLAGARAAEAKALPKFPERSSAAQPGGLCADARGNLIIFGGLRDWILTDEMWTWSAAEGTFKELKPAARPPARAYPLLAADPARGLWVLVGGAAAGPDRKWKTSEIKTLRDTWIYAGATNTWLEAGCAAPLPENLELNALWWDTRRGLLVLQELRGVKRRTWTGKLALAAP